jgi:ABC-2 type transport system permease protein
MKHELTWLPLRSAVEREVVRFYRQRGRIIGSLGTPIFFWIFLASGLGAAFPSPTMASGKGYTEFFYPGIVLMTVLFTSIFSTISLIEDRHEGFLQGVLVAPVSRKAVVGGKIAGGTLLALLQGLLLLLAAPFAGISLSGLGVAQAFLALGAVALALSAFSFVFAWKLDSVQGFHSVMNVLLMPMWLLSGAFFPLSRAPLWLKPLMWCNPLTYGLDALKQSFYVSSGGYAGAVFSYGTNLGIVVAFGLVSFAVAAREVSKGTHT